MHGPPRTVNCQAKKESSTSINSQMLNHLFGCCRGIFCAKQSKGARKQPHQPRVELGHSCCLRVCRLLSTDKLHFPHGERATKGYLPWKALSRWVCSASCSMNPKQKHSREGRTTCHRSLFLSKRQLCFMLFSPVVLELIIAITTKIV
jgi:hypothetical protein